MRRRNKIQKHLQKFLERKNTECFRKNMYIMYIMKTCRVSLDYTEYVMSITIHNQVDVMKLM